MSNAPSPAAALSRNVSVASLLALVALGLAWELWLAPTGQGTLAIKVLPLTFSIAGLLKYRLSAYRWISLLVWLYVGEGLVRATSDPGGPSVMLAVIEVVLGLVLFAAVSAHVRVRLRDGRSLAA